MCCLLLLLTWHCSKACSYLEIVVSTLTPMLNHLVLSSCFGLACTPMDANCTGLPWMMNSVAIIQTLTKPEVIFKQLNVQIDSESKEYTQWQFLIMPSQCFTSVNLPTSSQIMVNQGNANSRNMITEPASNSEGILSSQLFHFTFLTCRPNHSGFNH